MSNGYTPVPGKGDMESVVDDLYAGYCVVGVGVRDSLRHAFAAGAADMLGKVVAYLRHAAKPYESSDMNTYDGGVWWARVSDADAIESGALTTPASEEK